MSYKKILYNLGNILPIAMILRLVQYYIDIDPVTGYYKQNSIFSTLFYVFIILSAVIFFSVLFNKENKIEIAGEYFFNISSFEVISGFITAALYFVYVVVYPFSELNFMNMFICIFGIAASAFFVLFSLREKKYYLKTYFKLLALCPVTFFLLRTVSVFYMHTIQANVSSYNFELFQLAAFVLFFMNLAKYLLYGNNIRSVFFYGIWSLFGTALYSIPTILIYFFPGNIYRTGLPPLTEIMYLFTGIFIFSIVYKVSRYKQVPVQEAPQKPVHEDDTDIKSFTME